MDKYNSNYPEELIDAIKIVKEDRFSVLEDIEKTIEILTLLK